MILLKSANIVDGTGKPAYRADVLIKDDRISAIGTFTPKPGDEVIDALGMTLTPGFIDINTDSDHYLTLFSNPEQQDFLLQGVTTIVGGQCGSSLAPLFYGSLKSVRKWGNISQVNVDWHAVGELRDILRKRGLGVNFTTLIGHSTVRRDLVGEEIRDLTDSEFDIFTRTIEQGMREGARGLSAGLGYVHARNVSPAELERLLKTVAQKNGLYTTHLRDERAGVFDGVKETLDLAEKVNIPTVISHLRPIVGFEEPFRDSIALLNDTTHARNVYFDANPFTFSIMPIYTLLPGWAQHKNFEEMADVLRNPDHRERIKNDLIQSGADFGPMVIAEARGNNAIVGKTVGEFAASRELPVVDALLALMDITKLESLITESNINRELLEETLFHPRALIGSNTASFAPRADIVKSERSTSTFPRYLALAQKRGEPFEESIARITGMPARLLRLEKRGTVTEGAYADIGLYRDGSLTHLLVNGNFAVRDGAVQPKKSGKAL
ncbi:MAG: amidohydrolase family protein [Patescibacteria group bacterium]|nr:amidohydrolase family protein [Patescibacteria group bacterium]